MHGRLTLVLVALTTGCGTSRAPHFAAASPAAEPSPYYTKTCPVPPDVEGYAVVARAADGAFADTAYLRRVARRVVSAWRPPGEKVDPVWDLSDGHRSERWPHQEIGLWNEWVPGAADTATLAVTVRGDGVVTNPRLVSRSPNPQFTQSLTRINERLKAPCRRRGCLGRLPTSTPGDTLAVTLHFGARPGPGEAAVRWAANGLWVLPVPGNPTPKYPQELRDEGVSGEVVLRFDVDTAGNADIGSVEVLYSSHPLFVWEVKRALRSMRYRPAELNCRKVPWSVQQAFRFSVFW